MIGRGRGGDPPQEKRPGPLNSSSSSDEGGGSQEKSTSSSSNVTEQVVRGRGGAHHLVTAPANVTATKNPAVPKNCQTVELLTNFVGIKPMSDKTVHQYRFDFEPPIESVKLRGRLVHDHVEAQLFNGILNFDGMSDGRSTVKLSENPKVLNVSNDDGTKVTITIKTVGVVQWDSFEMLRLYNTDMKRFLRNLGFFQVNRGSYVHPQLSTPVPNQNITIIRGYDTAANLHDDGKILMTMEAVHKLMQDGTVLQIMNACLNNARRRNDNIEAAIRAELVGKLVVTKYNKRCYKIEDIAFDKTTESTFDQKGKQVSFIEYFEKTYGQKLNRDKSPMLRVSPSNAMRRRDTEQEQVLLLPPELCYLAGLTASQVNDMRLKMDLIKTCQLVPQARVDQLNQFINRFKACNDIKTVLERWGYEYEGTPKSVKGIILPTESICWKTNSDPNTYPKIDRATASFDNHLNTNKIAVHPKFPLMAVLIVGSEAQNQDALINVLQQGFVKVGLKPGDVKTQCLSDDRPASIANMLKRVPKTASLILIIIGKQNKGLYDAIKKCCTVDQGIPTQVVTAKLLMDPKKNRGAATKIAIQVAAKIGGEPWHIDLPLANTMICGYDTYHDTSQRGRSFGAFIASTNSKFSKWYSRIKAHERLEELSSNLAEDLAESLKNFKTLNGSFPSRVILYRDGVGDGQIEHVFKVELKQARKALKELDRDIKLSVIIVNKRVGARFYVRNNTQPCSNPIPGTVIDNTITRAGRYDFYLVSQSTRQGTITPTYYNVIFDESGWMPDKLQMLSYKMTLNYFNWTGGVRVPAPCQYAHKLAFQTGENTHAAPHGELANLLHFL